MNQDWSFVVYMYQKSISTTKSRGNPPEDNFPFSALPSAAFVFSAFRGLRCSFGPGADSARQCAAMREILGCVTIVLICVFMGRGANADDRASMDRPMQQENMVLPMLRRGQ